MAVGRARRCAVVSSRSSRLGVGTRALCEGLGTWVGLVPDIDPLRVLFLPFLFFCEDPFGPGSTGSSCTTITSSAVSCPTRFSEGATRAGVSSSATSASLGVASCVARSWTAASCLVVAALYLLAPALRIFRSSFPLGLINRPSTVLGAAAQPLWPAWKGPLQFSHIGSLTHGSPVCRRNSCPQLLHRGSRLHRFRSQ